jgi:hypothetical protein
MFCFPHFMPVIIMFNQAFWILVFFQWHTQSALSHCVGRLPWAKPSFLCGMLSRLPLEQLPLCSQQMHQSSIAHSELRQTFVRRLAVWSHHLCSGCLSTSHGAQYCTQVQAASPSMPL